MASVGWLVGREGERRSNCRVEGKWQRLPGFPLSATLSAATALPSNKQETSLAVRGNQELVPEPGPDAGRVGQIMRFGFPGLDNIRSHSDYVLSYDRRNRVPHWVFEHLTRHNILIIFLIIIIFILRSKKLNIPLSTGTPSKKRRA